MMEKKNSSILINEVKKVVTEELGVSNAVSDMTKEVIRKIVENCKGVRKRYDGSAINGRVLIDLWGTKYLVGYNLFCVADENDIKGLDADMFEAWSDTTKFEMVIPLFYIKNKNKYLDYDGSIQHEVLHVYQSTKTTALLKRTSKEIYQKAVAMINSDNGVESIVGFVLYYNNKFEQDAFANEFYRKLKEQNVLNPLDFLKTTTIYQNITVIKELVIDTDQYSRLLSKVVKDNFGKGYFWFLNMAKSVYSTYITKLGKVIAKYEKERHPQGKLVNIKKKIDLGKNKN